MNTQNQSKTEGSLQRTASPLSAEELRPGKRIYPAQCAYKVELGGEARAPSFDATGSTLTCTVREGYSSNYGVALISLPPSDPPSDPKSDPQAVTAVKERRLTTLFRSVSA